MRGVVGLVGLELELEGAGLDGEFIDGGEQLPRDAAAASVRHDEEVVEQPVAAHRGGLPLGVEQREPERLGRARVGIGQRFGEEDRRVVIVQPVAEVDGGAALPGIALVEPAVRLEHRRERGNIGEVGAADGITSDERLHFCAKVRI